MENRRVRVNSFAKQLTLAPYRSVEFNEATKLPVILPITHGGEFARRLGFAVPLTGIKTTGVVRCDQPRVIDLTARHGRKVDTLPETIMDEVLAKVATLFA